MNKINLINLYNLSAFVSETIDGTIYSKSTNVGFCLLGEKMKRCSKCKKKKFLSEFSKNKKTISGLCSRCKSCCNQYQQGYRQSEREYKQRYQSQIKAHRGLSVGLSDSLAYCEVYLEE